MAKTSERSATKAGRFTECPLFAATWDAWSDGMKPTALGTAPATGHVSLWTGVLSTALPPNHWAPVSPAKSLPVNRSVWEENRMSALGQKRAFRGGQPLPPVVNASKAVAQPASTDRAKSERSASCP